MKNLILLDNYYSPTERTERIKEWVEYYNNDRYHEAINNVPTSDKFFGRDKEILKMRAKTKKQTMKKRKKLNQIILLQSLGIRISFSAALAE